MRAACSAELHTARKPSHGQRIRPRRGGFCGAGRAVDYLVGMSSEEPIDPVRRAVDSMSPQEVAAVLDQLAALGTGPAPGVGFMPPERPETVIELPPPPQQPAALTVHVEVAEVEPPVWRRLVVRGDLSLEDLHQVIQRAVGWQNYHLHRFSLGSVTMPWRNPYFVTDGDIAEGEEGTHERDVRVDQVLRQVGDQLAYTYDFGDDWHHGILLESVAELDPEAPPAICTAGEMAGPLEDSGGPGGYAPLVEAFRGPGVGSLDEQYRDWLPVGWDPTRLSLESINTALSLIGASPQEVFASVSGGTPPPEALEPLLEIAPPDVVAEIAGLCRAAADARAALPPLGPEDLAQITAPYRLLVDLAGDDGIPLTSAGWMKPAVVEQIFTELRIGEQWIGKGNREDLTPPVAALRETTRELGLIRKLKGRLIRTQTAVRRSTDLEYVGVVAGGLTRHRHPWVQSARALFALCTASHGRAVAEWADTVADLMTRCGLSVDGSVLDRWDVLDMVGLTWTVLKPTGILSLPKHPRADAHAVALSVAALWPDRREVLGG